MNFLMLYNKIISLLGDNPDEKIIQRLKDYPNNKSSDEIIKILDEFIEAVREEYMQNGAIPKITGASEEVNQTISSLIKSSTKVYSLFSVIRQSQDIEKVNYVITDIFKRYVLRHGTSIESFDSLPREYSDIFQDIESIDNFIAVYNFLVYQCVGKLMSTESIRECIAYNTRIDKILVNTITMLIDSNFTSLQLNYLVMAIDQDET